MKYLFWMMLVASSAQAADLRIYSNFSEIREPQKVTETSFEYPFTPEMVQQLVQGSLYLEGSKVLSQVQTVTEAKAWLKAFEGQTLNLRTNDGVRAVTLINAEQGIVQDIETKRFRTNISADMLEFPSLPSQTEEGRTLYRFTVDRPGAVVLSYLTRGITWSPRYVLNVAKAGQAKLESYADIRNNLSTLVQVKTSELVAGQVDLNSYENKYQVQNFRAQMNTMAADVAAPGIESGVESAGIYSFALNRPFDLPGKATLTLPFIEPKVSVERMATLRTDFTPSYSKGKMNRMYRLTSDLLLPAGAVTVRDEGRIVGQLNIGDVAGGERYNMYLGTDPDLMYTRAVKVTNQTKTSTTYQVNLTVNNAKDRSVPFEYLERFGGNVVVDGKVEQVPEGIRVMDTLKAKGKLDYTYTLKFTY